ncbi:hypothetical protein DFS34DRAFT_696355 [Phlyctochytrium arcticum]|nr:hypothetical protein DFS34DRAFT_696355 [Phlyctochytrium arcticum]
MTMSGRNMLVKACLWLLLLKPIYATQACHPDAPATTVVEYTNNNGSTLTMTRASCYHDVAFYYNAALLARPKSEYAWFEPWVRQLWGYFRKNFGDCTTVNRTTDSVGGRQCENYGAPKPLIIFAFLDPVNSGSAGYTRFEKEDGTYRNHIKIDGTSFVEANAAKVKENIAHEMANLHELMPQGTHTPARWPVWGFPYGWTHFPLYDFYHQTGDFVSRDRFYNDQTGIHSWEPPGTLGTCWFSFWYELWLETGQNIRFLTKFWNYYALYYPKWQDQDTQVWNIDGQLTIGEVILFLSAAVPRFDCNCSPSIQPGLGSANLFRRRSSISSYILHSKYLPITDEPLFSIYPHT